MCMGKLDPCDRPLPMLTWLFHVPETQHIVMESQGGRSRGGHTNLVIALIHTIIHLKVQTSLQYEVCIRRYLSSFPTKIGTVACK